MTSFGGQIMVKNGEFLVFMAAEDSAEGLSRQQHGRRYTNA